MLARSTRINHPAGTTIVTPLLVPSFSSKGFGYNQKGKSEISEIYRVATEYLTESVLVSAYDLYYKNIPFSKRAKTDINIIDSGGYEVSDFQDSSTIYKQLVKPKKWDENKLADIYNRLPAHVPSVLINFDHPESRYGYQKQADLAKKFFEKFPNQLHTLLVKPDKPRKKYVEIEKIIPIIKSYHGFNFIGFTEKELGNSILKRMVNISKVRIALDECGITSPIHIFGSLDPITSVLYFLSGAEIFDGLTWLRFGFDSGSSLYQTNYGAKKIGIHFSDELIRGKTIQENLGYLLRLTHQMKKYLKDESFDHFEENSKLIKENYDLLKTENGGIK